MITAAVGGLHAFSVCSTRAEVCVSEDVHMLGPKTGRTHSDPAGSVLRGRQCGGTLRVCVCVPLSEYLCLLYCAFAHA